MASAGEESEFELPSDVESEVPGVEDDAQSDLVQLPSDVESEVQEVSAASSLHCSCKLRCQLQFDKATVEHHRNELLKDTANRQGQKLCGQLAHQDFQDPVVHQWHHCVQTLVGALLCCRPQGHGRHDKARKGRPFCIARKVKCETSQGQAKDEYGRHVVPCSLPGFG